MRFGWCLLMLVLVSPASAQCPPVWQQEGHPYNGGTVVGALFEYHEPTGKFLLHNRAGNTWEYLSGKWTQRTTNWPMPRDGASGCYEPERSELLMFGGHRQVNDGFSTLPSLWAWDGNAWSLRSSNGPARTGAAMCFDRSRSSIVVFGGAILVDQSKLAGDTWEYRSGVWSLRTESGPSPRTGHRMVWDSARGVAVLHGGLTRGPTGQSVVSQETWEWDGKQWSLRGQIAPMGSRQDFALVFNVARGRTWLVSGVPSSDAGDVWEWDGLAWTLLPTSGLAGRSQHVAAYNSASGRTAVIGGIPIFPGSTVNQMNFLEVPMAPAVVQGPADETTCLGNPITLTIVLNTASNVQFQWRRNGEPVSGQAALTLNIPQCAMTDAGTYDCVVSNSCGSATSNPATVRVLPDIRPNGQIDTADLTLFLAFFGFTTPSIADFNGDGLVNTVDLVRFLGAFGQSCGEVGP